MPIESGPELLQAHGPTLTRRRPAYSGGMVPGTGSEGLDLYNTMLDAMGARRKLGPADREMRAVDAIRA